MIVDVNQEFRLKMMIFMKFDEKYAHSYIVLELLLLY